MHNNMKMARNKYTRWHGYISLGLGNVPVTYSLSLSSKLTLSHALLPDAGPGTLQTPFLLCLASPCWPLPLGALQTSTLGGNRTLAPSLHFQGSSRLLLASVLLALQCFTTLAATDLFLAAFEYSLRFCPTLGKAALSDSASPDTSQPLFLLQRPGSHSVPSSELRH